MSALRCTIDLDLDGKQVGVVWVPDAYNDDSAWGSLAVPIACIKNGDGPTVLLLAGNHGDEYEGQVALRRLLAETAADDVTGTLILMPCLSPPAARAIRRLWPDGTNFNRVFPGATSGSAAQLLAHHLTTELFPRADVVGDFHSGGRTLLFPPMATMHLVDDPTQRSAMVDAALALNTEWMLVYADMGGDGLLPGEAERQGKTMVTSELGGAGMLTTEVVEVAYSGISNVARQVGVLRGAVRTRDDLRKPPTRIVSATDPENYVLAPTAGMLEPIAPFGSEVALGDPLARIYSFDELELAPRVVTAQVEGIVLASRPVPIVTRGDCIALIAQEVSREVLLG
jgi:N-alpha-acetyl-L-2,4-diaminobutyrate deacetylase